VAEGLEVGLEVGSLVSGSSGTSRAVGLEVVAADISSDNVHCPVPGRGVEIFIVLTQQHRCNCDPIISRTTLL
jgi:hypothetical protein